MRGHSPMQNTNDKVEEILPINLLVHVGCYFIIASRLLCNICLCVTKGRLDANN